MHTNRSPTLAAMVERGVRYINTDLKAGEIVFDTRALFLGLLAAGQQDRNSIRYGNTASWFTAWLTEKVGADRIVNAISPDAMSPPEIVFNAFARGDAVVLSVSVNALLPPAEGFSKATVGRDAFEARHLFAAMIEKGVVTDQVLQVFQASLAPSDLEALKRMLVDRVMGAPEEGESQEAWLRAFDLLQKGDTAFSRSGSEQSDPNIAAREAIAGFTRDSVQRGTGDVLDTLRDARALARLMCLEDAAPLAIAVFGGWGSGKSTFMDTLDSEVRAVIDVEAARKPDASTLGNNAARFVRRVVQMRFNAWQFVDANLWASLTAEFFDQLRAGGWDRTSGARYAGLVESVNSHVHSLTTEAEAKRHAVIESRKDVLRAQLARDIADKEARKAPGKALGQATLDALGDAYTAQKANLTALGLGNAGVDTGAAIDAFIDVMRRSRSILGQLRSILQLIGQSRRRTKAALLSAFFLVTALGLIAYYHTILWTTIPAIVAAIGAAGSICVLLLPALKVVQAATKRGSDIAAAVDAADDKAVKTLLKREIDLRNATIEAEALQSASDRAARALSRYVNPEGASNPPRLLRYVLEDDPNTKALQNEIGLIGRTRRLFQAVDDIVREERKKPADQRQDREVPDRIILYIDDLDRCTEEQTYSVLQAIHLLLAFELFVVVVGVDVISIQNALAKGIGVNSTNGRTQRERAVQYLEKIFQIAFWLRPLSADGGSGGSFARYVRTLAGSQMRGVESPVPAQPVVQAKPLPFHASLEGAPDRFRPKRPLLDDAPSQKFTARAPSSSALATIQLEAREIDFLASPAIAGIAPSTPRGVKRLINVYRLVRTSLNESGHWSSGDGKSVPIYPLIALMVAIETGQPVEVADAFYDALKSLGSSEALYQEAFFKPQQENIDEATVKMSTALSKCPRLKEALAEVYRLRSQNLTAGEALNIAKVARRFSFNYYH